MGGKGSIVTSSKTMHNLDDVFVQIGNAHFFQAVMLVCSLTPAIHVAWTMSEMSFAKAEPKWCCVPKNQSLLSKEYCQDGKAAYGTECPEKMDQCVDFLYDTQMSTIVSEWDLICDRKWKVDFCISIQMGGVLLGSLVAGVTADRFGRKATFFTSIGALAGLSLMAGFSTSWWMFTVFRALLGVCCGLYLVVNVPYGMELVGPSLRIIPSVVPILQLGGVALTLASWLLRDWRWLHWLCAATLAPLLASWFFLPESMRWLVVKGRLDEAEKVVAFIARANGKSVPVGCRQNLEATYEQEFKLNTRSRRSYGYLDLYRGWSRCKLSLILQVLWFIFSLCQYGIFFGASTLDLGLYTNLFLASASGIPFLMALMIVMPRIGRKTVLIVILSIAAICGFASLALYQQVSDESTKAVVASVLCLASLGLVNAAWAALGVLGNEAYPTVLRSVGYAATNTMARIGGIFAPFAFDFKAMPTVSYALVGSFMGICTLLVFPLDETLGLDLPDTLQEADMSRNVTSRNEKQDGNENTHLLEGAISGYNAVDNDVTDRPKHTK